MYAGSWKLDQRSGCDNIYASGSREPQINIDERQVVHPFRTQARDEQIKPDVLRNAFAFAG